MCICVKGRGEVFEEGVKICRPCRVVLDGVYTNGGGGERRGGAGG